MEKIGRFWGKQNRRWRALPWLMRLSLFILASASLLAVLAAQETGPTVEIDPGDPGAGDLVIISGSGWAPGEAVEFEIVETPEIHPPEILSALADAAGNIIKGYVVPGYNTEQTFTLTVRDLTPGSGATAQTTFTSSGAPLTSPTPTTPTLYPLVDTDKADYAPGEIVGITGSGWEPGEAVKLGIVETPLIYPAETLYAIADAEGNIYAEYVIQDDDVGVLFTLTATGETSGSTVQTTFTDSPCVSGCNDNNSCTTDSCNTSTSPGTCVHTPVTAGTSCGSQGHNRCDDANTCDSSGTCQENHKPDGMTCNDGNACTQTDSCQSGTCTGTNPVTCAAQDSCHVAGTCDTSTGVCSNPNAPDGTSCTDGNACTQTDSCQSGTCTGTNPVTCAAQDSCHVAGTCDTSTGVCSNPNAPDGTSCTDGNACTQTDSCQNGTCTGTNPVTCHVSDQCHVAGECNPSTGACSNPEAPNGTSCNDGNACTQSDSCQAGACTGSNPVVCVASDQCHVAGVCNTGTGLCSNPAAPNGSACSDGDACTQSDTCQAGLCTSGVYNFTGFFQPVDNLPVVNVAKAGSAIPVKFSLNCNLGLNIFTANYPKSQVITCNSTDTVEGIEETVTAGGSSLNYDPVTNQYIYVWKTDKAWAGTCRQLVVQLNDGTFHRANFKLTK